MTVIVIVWDCDGAHRTYRPTRSVGCLPYIHILLDWLPLPSAWHGQAFLGNKQTKIRDSERAHEWDGDAQQWCIQNVKECKQMRRGADTMFPASCSHRHTDADRRTDAQIHRGMTALWQAMDDYLVALGPFSSDLDEWLQIWAKPLCKWSFL